MPGIMKCTAVVVSLGNLPYIHVMVGYILLGVPLSLLAYIAISSEFVIRTGRSMADSMSLPCVLTNKLLHCGQTHSEPTSGSPRSWYHRARGRASRYNSIEWVSSANCPNHDQFAFRRPESSALRVGIGHQPKAKEEDPTTARVARAQGAGGVHSASWGNPRGGGRAGGGLKPEVTVMIGEDRPPRLGDVVTFEDMREFLVAYSENEQQIHITNQDGGGPVLARRRQL